MQRDADIAHDRDGAMSIVFSSGKQNKVVNVGDGHVQSALGERQSNHGAEHANISGAERSPKAIIPNDNKAPSQPTPMYSDAVDKQM